MELDQESWEKFIYGGRQVTITWVSRYLSLIDDTLTAVPTADPGRQSRYIGEWLGLGADQPRSQ